jgi:riboflavin synthase
LIQIVRESEEKSLFTGIVEEVGVVRETSKRGLVLGAHVALEGTQIGESIAVNGACLTVIALAPDSFTVDTVPETLRRTNLGTLHAGDPVNLERSLAANGRMGGHIVQGHVEGVGSIAQITHEGEALLVRVEAAPELMRYIVAKGFIAVDGISLTVIDRDEQGFSFTVIPHTAANTNLGARHEGEHVNLETDILGRYAAQLLGVAPHAHVEDGVGTGAADAR